MEAEDSQGDAARAEVAKITQDEGGWVTAHFIRAGPLSAAKTSLLQWLGAETVDTPPKLGALIATARSRAA